MSFFDFIETDPWPILKPKILAMRAECIEGLMKCTTLESLRQQQGFIEALDWVLEEAAPKPHKLRDDDDA